MAMANDGTDGRRRRRDTEAGRPLTGRAVLIWLLAFFGVVIGVNLLMAKLAIDTMPGTEVGSAYQVGNAYNAEISAARDQEARRWQVGGHLGRRGDGRAIIEVEARDGDGLPVSGLAFSAQIGRPVDRRDDQKLILTEHGAGIYSSDAADLAPGQWDLVLEADRGSQRLFMSKNRVVLE